MDEPIDKVVYNLARHVASGFATDIAERRYKFMRDLLVDGEFNQVWENLNDLQTIKPEKAPEIAEWLLGICLDIILPSILSEGTEYLIKSATANFVKTWQPKIKNMINSPIDPDPFKVKINGFPSKDYAAYRSDLPNILADIDISKITVDKDTRTVKTTNHLQIFLDHAADGLGGIASNSWSKYRASQAAVRSANSNTIAGITQRKFNELKTTVRDMEFIVATLQSKISGEIEAMEDGVKIMMEVERLSEIKNHGKPGEQIEITNIVTDFLDSYYRNVMFLNDIIYTCNYEAQTVTFGKWTFVQIDRNSQVSLYKKILVDNFKIIDAGLWKEAILFLDNSAKPYTEDVYVNGTLFSRPKALIEFLYLSSEMDKIEYINRKISFTIVRSEYYNNRLYFALEQKMYFAKDATSMMIGHYIFCVVNYFILHSVNDSVQISLSKGKDSVQDASVYPIRNSLNQINPNANWYELLDPKPILGPFGNYLEYRTEGGLTFPTIVGHNAYNGYPRQWVKKTMVR